MANEKIKKAGASIIKLIKQHPDFRTSEFVTIGSVRFYYSDDCYYVLTYKGVGIHFRYGDEINIIYRHDVNIASCRIINILREIKHEIRKELKRVRHEPKT